MKKIIFLSLAVFFLMASPAISSWSPWWWPPTSDTVVVPQSPTSSDVVAIILSGEWPDSCIPRDSAISVISNNIYFDVISSPQSGCYGVITPWEQTQSVGPLSPGTYSVYARLIGDSHVPETYTLMTQFTVTPHVPTIYYVDTVNGSDDNDGLTPQTAFATIQKAIDSAYNGDTVIVADGTYTGPGNRDIDFLGKAITLQSENCPESCIIDSNGTEAEFHRGFYFHNGEDANSVLDGFTITNGYINDGGGILCKYNSSPTITNCIITENWAYLGGGMRNRDSNPTLINCTFNKNSSDFVCGGMSNRNSNPTLINCIFSGNKAGIANGGMDNWKCNPTLINCIFSGNKTAGMSGGMENSDSNSTLINCIFSDNLAYSGGGMSNYNSNLTLINCIFSGNLVEWWGGGMLNRHGSNLILTNCTFTENSALNGNALAFYSREQAYPSDLQMTNCILADDSNEIWNNDGSTIVINYSNIKDGWPGIGNIDADPCFFEPGYWADANDPNAVWVGGDYHLLLDSPCIDAGDNNSVPADIHDLDGDGNTAEPLPFDLDGNPRFVDRPDIEDTGNGTPPIVDMGAYEAMVSCFGVNHVKLGTKAGKKGNKVEVKGTFDPASPIDFAVDDVTYTIDDGLDYMLTFIIPAGSFEPEGKPDKQKFRFHSAKGSQPDIKARFDFLKCKFELKVKEVMDTSEITAETLAIVLQAGANLVEEVVQVQAKPKHLEFKREPKLNCCQM